MSYSPGPFGNIMSRLQGLKNVSKRKVMPGEGILQEKEEFENDVSGTAQPMPNYSMPIEQGFSNGEVSNQLENDVRANAQINPDQEEDQQGFFSKLGNSLANMVQSQAAGASQMTKGMVDRYAGTATGNYNPPPQPEQPPQEAGQGFSLPQNPEPALTSLSKGIASLLGKKNEPAFPFTENREYIDQPPGYMDEKIVDPNEPSLGRSMTDMVKGMVDKQGGSNYVQNQPAPPSIEKTPEEQALEQQELDKAQERPWEVAAYGANDKFANNPESVAEFEKYTGIEYTNQIKNTVDQYEKILSDRENGIIGDQANYDEQAKRINDRINSNQTTDSDKFFIGLALAMPLIIGGMFGKEAALGALGGGAKGLSAAMGQRQDSIRKDEALLAGVKKQRDDSNFKRSEIELERLKLPGEIRKNNPNPNEDMIGMNIATFKDPNTGEVIASGPEILPGFVANTSFANTPKAREALRGKASELSEEKAALQKANSATYKLAQAAMQIKDPGIIGKLFSYALSDENSALKKKFKQDAPQIFVDGRWQNSAVYIDSFSEQLKDAYRRNEGMKALTNTVSDHMANMVGNSQYSGLKPDDMIDQLMILLDRSQNFFVDKVKSQGFLGIPIEQEFGKENKKLYSDLNKREEKKQLVSDKQKMHGSK